MTRDVYPSMRHVICYRTKMNIAKRASLRQLQNKLWHSWTLSREHIDMVSVDIIVQYLNYIGIIILNNKYVR